MKKNKNFLCLITLWCSMIFHAYGTLGNEAVCIGEVGQLDLFTDTLRLHSSAEEYMIDVLEPPILLVEQIATKDLFLKFKADQMEKYSQLPDSLVYFGNQPFLLGAVKAYQEHRPIVISPDMIWLLIEQGFARHIALHADKFSDRLVGFDGKKELTVVVDGSQFSLDDDKRDWEQVFPQFVDQIEMYAGKDYVRNLRADFTTTDATSKIASEIVLMESVKAYFDYRVMMIGCGISSITLEGTLADWKKIIQKLDYIETFDLGWWTKELRPVILEIIQTKEGVLNKDFWRNIVQLQRKAVYSPHETIDGWITKFYPFNDKGEQRALGAITHVNNIAAEYVKVPFVLEDRIANKTYQMEFWSGIFGIEQDFRNYKLRPAIGWAVVRNNQIAIDTPPNESYDQVSLKNIKEIPQQFYALKQIDNLTLGFLGKVNIPDRIKDIKINRLYVTGEITGTEESRLKKRLPDVVLFINGREVRK